MNASHWRWIAAVLLAPVVATPLPAQGLPAEVLGARPAGRVVDPTGRLSADERREITALLDGIAAQTRGDMMVAVIPSTRGEPHRQFATALFNRWQLGAKSRDDGLLLFAALDDRRAEIILGDGLDDAARQAQSQRVMNDVMIPAFKAGRPGEAIRKGALACATEILGGGAEARSEPEPAPPAVIAGAGPAPLDPGAIPAELPPGADGLAEPVVPRPWVALPPPAPEGSPWGGLAALGGGLTATGAGGYGLWHLATRRRRRACPRCHVEMIKLDEFHDDAHLEGSQRAEETVGSVDYDIWTCPSCAHVDKVRYGRFFTQYSRCPSCKAVTTLTTTSRVRSPTTVSEGVEEVTESCGHCNRHVQFRRSIPRLSAQTSSHVNWSGSSSSGRSVSSGGGSFGGGRSSGGGASGSW